MEQHLWQALFFWEGNTVLVKLSYKRQKYSSIFVKANLFTRNLDLVDPIFINNMRELRILMDKAELQVKFHQGVYYVNISLVCRGRGFFVGNLFKHPHLQQLEVSTRLNKVQTNCFKIFYCICQANLYSPGEAHCWLCELKFFMKIKKQIILYHVPSSQIFNEYPQDMFKYAGHLLNSEFLGRCENN